MKKVNYIFALFLFMIAFSCEKELDNEQSKLSQSTVKLANGFEISVNSYGRPSWVTDEMLETLHSKSNNARTEVTCEGDTKFAVSWGRITPPDPRIPGSGSGTGPEQGNDVLNTWKQSLVMSNLYFYYGNAPTIPTQCLQFELGADQMLTSPFTLYDELKYNVKLGANGNGTSGTFNHTTGNFAWFSTGPLKGGPDILAYTWSELGNNYYFLYLRELFYSNFVNTNSSRPYNLSILVDQGLAINSTTCGNYTCYNSSNLVIKSIGNWDIKSISPMSVASGGSVTVVVEYNDPGCPTCYPPTAGTVTVGSTNSNQNQKRLNPVNFTIVPGQKTYTVTSTAYRGSGTQTVPVGVKSIPYGNTGTTQTLTIF